MKFVLIDSFKIDLANRSSYPDLDRSPETEEKVDADLNDKEGRL